MSCDSTRALPDAGNIDGLLKSMRALLQAARERVVMLQPFWGAHLASETLRHLADTVDELERRISTTDTNSEELPETLVQLDPLAVGRGDRR